MADNRGELYARQGVVFDLDGTLWDSSYQVGLAWNHVFSLYGVDLRLTPDNMKVMMGRTVPEIGEALLPDIDVAQRNRILKDCCEEENRRLRLFGGALYDGVTDTLEILSSRMPLFVVSNCEKGYINAFLEYHNMARLVKDHECIGCTGLCKGDNIRLIMQRNGLSDAIYVGDTQRDMLSAAQAGVSFIRAGYGFGGMFNAEYCIDAICELPQMIDCIFNNNKH